MIKNIPYSTLSDSAAQICAKGNAVEFIQPWYTPISTTPENTGMAIGGIGNAFTLTPLGNTPSFSFIPGIFIDNDNDAYHFNDFYLSIANPVSISNLRLKSVAEVAQYLHFYPASFNQNQLDCSSNNDDLILTQIIQACEHGQFYLDNKVDFARWNIEFSSKAKREIAQNPISLECNLIVALEFFNGLLINKTDVSVCLTAQLNEDDTSITTDPTVSHNPQKLSAQQIHYTALYPSAEYDYALDPQIKIIRKVTSPIVKGDKKLCSLPLHWNEFEIENNADTVKVITLVQALPDLLGSNYAKSRPGVQDSACYLIQNPVQQQHTTCGFDIDKQRQFNGVSFTSQSPYVGDIEGEIIFGIDGDKDLIEQGKLTISVKPSVYTTKQATVINTALNSQRINEQFDHGIYSGREALSGVVCVRVELQPGEKQSVRFVQVMDHSQIRLQQWESKKAYTQFYPNAHRAVSILHDVLPDIDAINGKIRIQQTDFLTQAMQTYGAEFAPRFATMAMNTLSFLAEATVWDVEDKFLVKECVDYPFFNSLDVYFYGSYSLLYLLPEIDGCVMREFARAILAKDATKRRFWEYEDKPYAQLMDTKYEGTRAIRGAVIHDLGSPFDVNPDAYSWHNVKEWKDLAPKYILMVLRHYKQTGDLAVVQDCWQAVQESIAYLTDLIANDEHLPLTRGTDDTFDNLSSHGISIYCASLWVAGLEAASELALLLKDVELSQHYREKSAAALDVLQCSLWDDELGYFHFFITPIQAKHLTGQGYQELATLGLELTGNPSTDKDILNHYLNQSIAKSNQTKVQSRIKRKVLLQSVAPHAFTSEFNHIAELDSDNSFGDALLADSYLKLLGLKGLFADEQVKRALDYIYQHNFKVNSPKLGVANMTLADGQPHEAFQAQDVWIGVQFSTATALQLAGKTEQAVALMETVYHALYHEAKIPFAAPEGFNCSVIVDANELSELLNIDGSECIKQLQELNCVLSDGRVNPDIVHDSESFIMMLTDILTPIQAGILHQWLLNTGLKYTAGRYFRPGMIFACLPQALKSA